MNKDSKEYQRVRREMDNKLVEIVSWDWYNYPDQCLTDALDEILSIEGLAILADDQKAPEFLTLVGITNEELVAETRKSMREAGFKKII